MILLRFVNKHGKTDAVAELFEELAVQVIREEVNKVQWSYSNLNEIYEQVVAEQMGWTEE
jgi:hypothetical protein